MAAEDSTVSRDPSAKEALSRLQHEVLMLGSGFEALSQLSGQNTEIQWVAEQGSRRASELADAIEKFSDDFIVDGEATHG